jgi:hypothetical protein
MNLSELKLVKFQYLLNPDEVDDFLATNMTKKQREWAQKVSETVPSDSSSEDSGKAWDVFLADDDMLKEIEKFIKEIGLSFHKIDLSEEYCKNEGIADIILQNKIRRFLETNYSIDYILDRINEVGISTWEESKEGNVSLLTPIAPELTVNKMIELITN